MPQLYQAKRLAQNRRAKRNQTKGCADVVATRGSPIVRCDVSSPFTLTALLNHNTMEVWLKKKKILETIFVTDFPETLLPYGIECFRKVTTAEAAKAGANISHIFF